jgi:hypothetical protein
MAVSMKLNEYVVVTTVTVVLLKVLCAGLSIKIGANVVTMGSIDAATVAALLTPVLGALHLRDYIKTKKGSQDEATG